MMDIKSQQIECFYQGVAGTFQYHRWKRDTQTV